VSGPAARRDPTGSPGAVPPPDERIGGLGTEGVRPELGELDRLTSIELVELMCADTRRVPDALVQAVPDLALAVDAIVAGLEAGGRLVYVGAGTAGRIGMLDAAEAGPTFNAPPGQVVAVLAGGSDAFAAPAENAEDDAAAGAVALRAIDVGPSDAVVGISASGRTPYVLGALAEAKARGATTVGVACNPATPLGTVADVAIEIPVGPEVIAGSTRLNAGTAQKVVVNVLSTASMVRLGKTFGNLMVDVRATNEKLRDRAVRIVMAITATTADVARAALERAGWQPKVASLLVMRGLDVAGAEELLAASAGRLRVALDSPVPNAPTTRPGGGGTRRVRRLGVAGAVVGGVLVGGDVAIESDEVVAVGLAGGGSGIAAPGLVDLQVNGYAGVDALTGTHEELEEMSLALLRVGVVAFQPTLITAEPTQTVDAIGRLDLLRRRPGRGARILGVHLEGPFLSRRRPGTHPLEWLRAPDPGLLSRLLAAGRVTMVTLAPELPGSLELIEACRRHGVVVALGHSAATAEEARAAFDAGASAVTHLFNAMEPLSARAPGLAAAALTRPGVAVQLIADGRHVSDDMVRLAFAAAGRRCSLVSDVLSAGGSPEGPAHLGEVAVEVRGGLARRADGTIAGAVAPLPVGLARLVALGLPLEIAVQAVTERPGRLAGDPVAGRLLPGSRADLVVLDDAGVVRRVLFEGNEVEPG